MRNGDYELVVAPPDYPGKLYRGRYCYKHHLIWWQTHGELAGPGEIVHHKDENGYNNDPSNLEKKTKLAHNRHHHPTTTGYPHTCEQCGVIFYRRCPSRIQRFCSRYCMAQSMLKPPEARIMHAHTCEHCGKLFYRNGTSNNQRYCSRKCNGQATGFQPTFNQPHIGV